MSEEGGKVVEHPRFTCRREGHDLPITFTNLSATLPCSAVVVCRRCGQEVTVDAEVVTETSAG